MKRLPIIAAVIGVLTLSIVAVAQGPEAGHCPEGGCTGGLACLPDITAEQLEEIQALREEMKDSTEDLRDEIREARESLRELMNDPEPDIAAVRSAKERLDGLETEMLINMLEHRSEVRSKLTAEQRVFFDEMHHGMPGGRGGHPGGGPGMGGPRPDNAGSGPQGPGPEAR